MILPSGEVTRLTDTEDYKPIWSPDGTQIVFVSLPDEGEAEVYMMDGDGENERRLTESEGFDEPWG